MANHDIYEPLNKVRSNFSTWDCLLEKLGLALNPTVITWVALVLEAAQRMQTQEKEAPVEEKTHNQRPTIMGLEALVDQLGQDL